VSAEYLDSTGSLASAHQLFYGALSHFFNTLVCDRTVGILYGLEQTCPTNPDQHLPRFQVKFKCRQVTWFGAEDIKSSP